MKITVSIIFVKIINVAFKSMSYLKRFWAESVDQSLDLACWIASCKFCRWTASSVQIHLQPSRSSRWAVRDRCESWPKYPSPEKGPHRFARSQRSSTDMMWPQSGLRKPCAQRAIWEKELSTLKIKVVILTWSGNLTKNFQPSFMKILHRWY